MSVPDPIIEQPVAALALRPVDAATITPGGPVFIGLGDLDLTCPKVCPKVRLPPAQYRYLKVVANTPDPWNPNDTNFPMTPLCGVCHDSGQCVPVSGPHLIVVDGVILWYAHIEYLPVVERQWVAEGFEGVRRDVIATMPTDHPAYGRLHLWRYGAFHSDITGAPGSWKPGGWAAHVTQISDTIEVECTGCSGTGQDQIFGRRNPSPFNTCPDCNASGTRNRRLPLVLSSAPDRPRITTLDLNNLGAS